ncbi:MAG: SRPBCC family protein [Caulobacteraceae bacterium]
MVEATNEPGSVIIEREMAFPPERVWRAITQPHLIEEWLMKCDFQAVEGHRFTLRRNPRPDVEIVIQGEVIKIDPPKTLSYSWSALELESIITWTLTPTRGGTRVRLEHKGFRPDQKRAQAGATAAWRGFFVALEEVLGRMN